MKRILRPWVFAPVGLVALVWFVGAYLPSNSAIAAAEARVEAAELERELTIAERSDLEEFASDMTTLEQRELLAALAVPEEPRVGEFVRTIEAHADASGVQVETISPNAVSDDTTFDGNEPLPSGVSAVTIAVGATGSYAGISEFLGAFETGQRLVLIDAISLSLIDDRPDVLSIDFTLRIFTSSALVADDGFDDDAFDNPSDEEPA